MYIMNIVSEAFKTVTRSMALMPITHTIWTKYTSVSIIKYSAGYINCSGRVSFRGAIILSKGVSNISKIKTAIVPYV